MGRRVGACVGGLADGIAQAQALAEANGQGCIEAISGAGDVQRLYRNRWDLLCAARRHDNRAAFTSGRHDALDAQIEQPLGKLECWSWIIRGQTEQDAGFALVGCQNVNSSQQFGLNSLAWGWIQHGHGPMLAPEFQGAGRCFQRRLELGHDDIASGDEGLNRFHMMRAHMQVRSQMTHNPVVTGREEGDQAYSRIDARDAVNVRRRDTFVFTELLRHFGKQIVANTDYKIHLRAQPGGSGGLVGAFAARTHVKQVADQPFAFNRLARDAHGETCHKAANHHYIRRHRLSISAVVRRNQVKVRVTQFPRVFLSIRDFQRVSSYRNTVNSARYTPLNRLFLKILWGSRILNYITAASLLSNLSFSTTRGKQMNPIYQYAGLSRAKEPGLSVETCAHQIQRLAYVEERLMFLQATHIVTTPQRDLKTLLSRLQYEDGLHSDKLKTRLIELRVSKDRSHKAPDERLKVVLDEAMYSDGSVEIVAALRTVFKPALLNAYHNYESQTNGLADYESVRLIRHIIAEEEEGLRLLEAAYQDVVNTPEKVAQAQSWADTLQEMLQAAGGIVGEVETKVRTLQPRRSHEPFRVARKPERDSAFPRVWDIEHVDNQRVQERLVQMIATRLGEITIAEALAIVLWEVKRQPWSFYVAISRHMWDEMRHSLFGEAAAEYIYGDRAVMPLRDFEIEYLFKMTPLELYAMLGIGVEAALMKYPPGKRAEYEFCRDVARHPLMSTLQDFDWADEVEHVNIARRQLKEWFQGDNDELAALAEKGMEFRAQTRRLHAPAAMPDLSEARQGCAGKSEARPG